MQRSHSSTVKAFSLQFVLIVPFVLQIFGAVGLVGYLSFKNGQKAVNDLADRLMERTSSIVDQHLNSYLSVPTKVLQINSDAIELGLLNVRDRKTAGKYFWKQIQAYDLSYIGIGLKTGEGVGAGRYDGKNLVIDDWGPKPPKNWYIYATDNRGNRTKVVNVLDWNNFKEPWYTEPIKAGRPIWSPFITANYPNYPFIVASMSRPIYNRENQLLGMAAADIHLLKLSDFLRRLDIGHSGQVFIVERNGMMIANSSVQQPFTKFKDKILRLKAIDSPDPMVKEVAQQIQQTFNAFESITESKKLAFHWLGEQYFVHVTPWRDRHGLDWLVVVSIPEQAFMTQVNANTQTSILLCMAALVVATLMGLLTSHWITRPIVRLNKASQAMASGNLDQTVEISSIQELNSLAHSFNDMVGQLRQSFSALEKSNVQLEDRAAELKTTLSELQRTQAQVMQNEKMASLGQLVAGVAHEINNPVSFIHGNITYLHEYTQDLLRILHLYQQHPLSNDPEIQALAEEIDLEFLMEDLQKILTSMKTGTDRIRNIVLSLRNFSRVDEADWKAVDIHEGIESTLLILQHRLKDKSERLGIQVIRNYGNLPQVECYPAQLNQVFMNILVNAIDALDEVNAKRTYEEREKNPSYITVRTSIRDSQWVEIAIADNGIGMSQIVKNQVFDPFFTTKPVGKGTGMGMAISYHIITEKHGGRLECFSSFGTGTEFIVLLPLKSPLTIQEYKPLHL
ncbi:MULTISPECIES: ATP-binding protein [Nostocales]|uniref:histidine kinase n=3 Tax=Nostocales TaxID=1161 RepID=A0A0C1MWG0_9CYAN|nr:ATP-binding protein [Tolypothrix bouteillei]KAF3891297.1 HAMP domain-containing protein [Tolypothrix bouteillei VB521301]